MTVQLAPPIVFQSFLSTGAPNAFGTVATYIAGTTTPQATWVDSTQTTQNQNPTPLNAQGQASIWLATNLVYKIIVFDSLGNQINFQDQIIGGQNLSSIQQSGLYGTDSGVVNAYIFTHAGTVPAPLATGTLIRFTPLNTNTLASTINVDGTGVISITRQNNTFCTGGELSSAGPTVLQYNGTSWQIVSTCGAQPGYERTAAEVAASVTPTNYQFSAYSVPRYMSAVQLADFLAQNLAVDQTSAFQTCLNIQTGFARTVCYAPKGGYLVASPLYVFNNTLFYGDGNATTFLNFSGVGEFIQMGAPINSSTASFITIRDIWFQPNVSSYVGGAGIVNVGGSYVFLERVQVSGFNNCIILDQTEVCSLRDCVFHSGTGHNSDLWLVAGSAHTMGVTFTAGLAANATSGTLTTGNWPGVTGYYNLNFVETVGGAAEPRSALLTNGSSAVTWARALAAACNATTTPGSPTIILTFTAGLAINAVSGTLATAWGGATGYYSVNFVESVGGASELRSVLLTNASTAVTWPVALAAACNALTITGSLFTNRILIDSCEFGSNGTYSIQDDGGVNHQIHNSDFFGAVQYCYRGANVRGLSYIGNESEGGTSGDIYLDGSLANGAFVGPVAGFTLAGNTMVSNAVTYNASVNFAVNGVIMGNLFGQAVGGCIGLTGAGANLSAGIVIEGNDKLMNGNNHTSAPFINGNGAQIMAQIIRQVAVTSVAASQAAGAQSPTPLSMEGIRVGARLTCRNIDGTNGEQVFVTAVTGATFTATFASSKTANFIVQGSDPIYAYPNAVAGAGSFSAAATSTVNFTEQFDTNYKVAITMTSDAGAALTRPPWVSAKGASSFTLSANAAITANFDWVISRD